MARAILLRRARENNLRDLNVAFPWGRLTVVTGVSGSGKSSLLVESLAREALRRLFLAKGSGADPKWLAVPPALGDARGLLPAAVIRGREPPSERHTTVGALLGVEERLRGLFLRLGTVHCPRCGEAAPVRTPDDLVREILAGWAGQTVVLEAPLVRSRRGRHERLLRELLEEGWLRVRVDGREERLEALGSLAPAEPHTLSLIVDRFTVRPERIGRLREAVANALARGGGRLILRAERAVHAFAAGRVCTRCGRTVPPVGLATLARTHPAGACPRCRGTGRSGERPCRACRGTGLGGEAARLRWEGRSYREALALPAGELARWLAARSLPPDPALAAEREAAVARLHALGRLGLGELPPARPAADLTAGEFLRVQLALCLAAPFLPGLYVVDAADGEGYPPARRHIEQALAALRAEGATVVAAAGDPALGAGADRVLVLGPGAGPDGGRLVDREAEGAVPKAPSLPPVGPPLPRALPLGRGTLRLRRGELLVLVGPDGRWLRHRAERWAALLQAHVPALLGAPPRAADSPLSFPATLLGVFPALRRLYAGTPGARQRGWRAAFFRLDRPGGRCEACRGMGRVPLGEGLGVLAAPCSACGGGRYRPEVEGALWAGLSLPALLLRPAAELPPAFRRVPALAPVLAGLAELGLGYVPLGQPAASLSRGELRRLAFLALWAGRERATVFLLAEPTVGLHPRDVARWVAFLRPGLERGHTVVALGSDPWLCRWAHRVVEVDGEGRRLFAGPPAALAAAETPVARALCGPPAEASSAPPPRAPALGLEEARTHNLQGVSLTLAPGRLHAVTGPSGSGKSSLLLDTLGAEAEGRFADLWALAGGGAPPPRPRPPVRRLVGLPAAVVPAAVPVREEGSVVHAAGLAASLGLLFARLGSYHCPECDAPLRTAPRGALGPGEGVLYVLAPLPPFVRDRECLLAGGFVRLWAAERVWDLRREAPPPAVWPGAWVVVDRLPPGAPPERLAEALALAWRFGGGKAELWSPGGGRRPAPAVPACPRHGPVPEGLEAAHFAGRPPRAPCLRCAGRGCARCEGGGWSPLARAVRLGGWRWPELLRAEVGELPAWLAALPPGPLTGALVPSLERQVQALLELGLGHLPLGRPAASLGYGARQRLRFAALLAAPLEGCLVLLDEPGQELHPAEKERLGAVLARLRRGRRVVVFSEHDPELLRRADRVWVFGPGGGRAGGRLVAAGSPAELDAGALGFASPSAPPGTAPPGRRSPRGWLRLAGLRRRNLRNLTVALPLGVLTVVLGPEGSGKRTLVFGEIGPQARRSGRFQAVRAVRSRGAGLSPRAMPLSLAGAFPALRELLAAQPEARLRGFGPGHFAPGSPAGSCPVCRGTGRRPGPKGVLEPPGAVCPACGGRRFQEAVLAVRYRGKNLDEILAMEVAAAAAWFRDHPRIAGPLEGLLRVGLGYLRLGQPGDTLSTGERTRLRLARDLLRPARGAALYLLDEPTRGLSRTDVAPLLAVLGELREAGHTVVCVDHHPDLVTAADHVLELGPAGGRGGGRLVAAGPPERVAAGSSPTAAWIRRWLQGLR